MVGQWVMKAKRCWSLCGTLWRLSAWPGQEPATWRRWQRIWPRRRRSLLLFLSLIQLPMPPVRVPKLLPLSCSKFRPYFLFYFLFFGLSLGFNKVLGFDLSRSWHLPLEQTPQSEVLVYDIDPASISCHLEVDLQPGPPIAVISIRLSDVYAVSMIAQIK